MTNEQLAHDLAVAYMAGKQLPVNILVEEYYVAYKSILEHLNSQPIEPGTAKATQRPF